MSSSTVPGRRAGRASSSPARGRTAKTKGVSMLPDEFADAATVEELTGVGFSELYRRVFAPQVHAAAKMLQEAKAAGFELDRAKLRDVWDVHMSAEELISVYSSASQLTLGD